MANLTLISFPTCPYVQRAVISLKEKNVDFDVVYIDLANKPDWFLAISPLGKVPVLKIAREGKEDAVLFESSVILEYLEETAGGVKLHPADPLERARHRGWMEFGSTLLGDLFRYSTAKDAAGVEAAKPAIAAKLAQVEKVLGNGPYFAGETFSLVDAVFAPAFRQLATLAPVTQQDLTSDFPKVSAWAKTLLARPSIASAVPADFKERYLARLAAQGSHLLKDAA
jgi:glutathione S-transferase